MDIESISKLAYAYAGRAEVPYQNMDLAESLLFYRLRDIYTEAQAGVISNENGKKYKSQALAEYSKDRTFVDELSKMKIEQGRFWSRIETAAWEYSKNPSLETAQKFFEAVYNAKAKEEEKK